MIFITAFLSVIFALGIVGLSWLAGLLLFNYGDATWYWPGLLKSILWVLSGFGSWLFLALAFHRLGEFIRKEIG